jgi:hypothetical protein
MKFLNDGLAGWFIGACLFLGTAILATVAEFATHTQEWSSCLPLIWTVGIIFLLLAACGKAYRPQS